MLWRSQRLSHSVHCSQAYKHRYLTSSARNLSNSSTKLPGPLDVLFFGREEFSCESFKFLHEAKDLWKSITVATTADQRVGRGRKDLSISPLKVLAQDMGVPIVELPTSDEEFASWTDTSLPSFSPTTALITASFGRAIPSNILALAPSSLRLNIHPSLLPLYRGAAPIQRQIIRGEGQTGVSILQMEDVSEKGFDAGDVWGQRTMIMPIRPSYSSLEKTLARKGGELLVEVLRARMEGKLTPTPQDHATATRAPKITPRTARVNWHTWTPSRVSQTSRAIQHQRPLVAFLPDTEGVPGTLVHLFDIIPMSPEGLGDAVYSRVQSLQVGEATYVKEFGGLLARCAPEGSEVGFVIIPRLQTEGRKMALAHEWWNGFKGSVKPHPITKLRVLKWGSGDSMIPVKPTA